MAIEVSVDIPAVAITVNGNETHHYSHVISTIPLPVLRTIDLSGAGLDVMQRNAVNEVDCFPAFKIAILFKSNWWTTKLGIVGGRSVTDLPLHEIIYPSYGIDSNMPSKVLIASYALGGDALRLGTLATSSRHPGAFKELVLRNLAEVHGGLNPDVSYAYLKEQFVDMHVKDWIRDEYAMGKSRVSLSMIS
jgi:monoamine oxidase